MSSADDPGFAALTAMPKVVFPSTLEPPLGWANTELVGEDAVDAVRDMKQRGSRPLRTLGSLRLCRSLLGAGLVDRLRVVVFPVVNGATGNGPGSLDGWPDVALDLAEEPCLFDGRLQMLEYVPRGARRAAALTSAGRTARMIRLIDGDAGTGPP